MKYAFIERNHRHWPISVSCEVLEVSPNAIISVGNEPRGTSRIVSA